MKKQAVYFVSLGCPKNRVDTEVMLGLSDRAGFSIARAPEDADAIVVNTCGFIGEAKEESIDTILEMAKHKTEGRARKLVVAGCLVERFRHEIQKNIPEVDAVVGTGELEGILAAAGISRPGAPQAGTPFDKLSAGSAATQSPFTILQSRPEGVARESAGRFSRDEWDGAVADLPNYLYDDC